MGRVCVECLFDLGLNVGITYTSEKSRGAIPERVTRNPERLLARTTDLTAEVQVDSFVGEVREKFGSVDYLVNAAGGYMGGKSIDEVGVDEWEGIMNINLRTTFLTCRAILRLMRVQRFGRIVNISAMAALSPAAKRGPYAISKRGVITLTETIAEEVKGTGITANAIAPSIIVTKANQESMPGADYSKWVEPDEIADLVLYLCSDEAKSVNGNVIRISGGV